MADPQKHDLRDDTGKPRATPAAVDPEFIGKDGTSVLPDTGEHEVKPLAGDTGGVAEGQVTKSN
jgi:hypothetical protein